MFSIKELKTEEGRRKYYAYDPSTPSTMVHHAEPWLDPRFNAELYDMFGVDTHGDQRLRIVWAGTLRAQSFKHMDDGSVVEYEGMKYPYMRLRLTTGFIYMNDEGKKVRVASKAQVPEGKVFVEDISWDDLGHMKFVIEMKFTAQELVLMGRYPKPGSDEEKNWCVKNGRRYRQAPNPNGEYVFCHYVETPEGEYADVTDATIDQIRKIFHTALTETDAEFVARKLKQREEVQAKVKEMEQKNYDDAYENARGRAESKLAKGKVVYG